MAFESHLRSAHELLRDVASQDASRRGVAFHDIQILSSSADTAPEDRNSQGTSYAPLVFGFFLIGLIVGLGE